MAKKELLQNLVRECLQGATAIIYDNPYDYVIIDYDLITSRLAAREDIEVFPVNVGDTLWYIKGGYYNAPYMESQAVEVTELSKKKCGKVVEWGFIAGQNRYKFSSIGKTIFRTREACEAAIENKKNKKKGDISL